MLAKADNDLFNTTQSKSDKAFIKSLSKWIIKYTGNVNVAQRLNCIAIQNKLGVNGGN